MQAFNLGRLVKTTVLNEAIPLVLLVDWRLTGGKFWLQEKLEAEGFKVSTLGIPNYSMRNRVVRWRKLILWWQYLRLGYKGARMANRDSGMVVAWNFVTGAFAAQFVPKGSRRVLSLNLIALDKGVVNHALRFLIYRRAFSSGRITATVTSEEDRDRYLKLFRIHPNQISVLRECWAPQGDDRRPALVKGGFVFSGGEASRDWESLLTVAEKLPGVKFKIVARGMNWSSKYMVPPNVEVFVDLDEGQFYTMARESRFVLLLLKGRISAGLIVLKRAILLGKLVISTDTGATKPYYPEMCRDLLVPEGDIAAISSVLARYHGSPELTLKKALLLQAFVKEHYSPDAFSKRVSELVRASAES